MMSLQWFEQLCEDRSQLFLYLHINKPQFPLHIIHFPLYNSGKGPCRCSLGFYVKSYLTDRRKCQPNPKVKNNLIIPFRERSPVTDACELWGHMHLSLLSLRKKKQLASHTFVYEIFPINSMRLQLITGLVLCLSSTQFTAADLCVFTPRNPMSPSHSWHVCTHFVFFHRWPPSSLIQVMEDVRRLLFMDCILNSWVCCFSLAGADSALYKITVGNGNVVCAISSAPLEELLIIWPW